MKKISQYILEKFKISNNISIDEEDELIERALDIIRNFKKVKNLDPEFVEWHSNYNKYRIYPVKGDKSFYIFGNTIIELYWAVCNTYGSSEQKKEAEELRKKERDSKK